VIPKAGIFLDASVLLAAAGSPQGGSSAAIAQVAHSEEFEVLVSSQVLREALGNVRLKFGQAAVIRLYTLLAQLQPRLVGPRESAAPANLPASVAVKDHHILQACVAAGASICLTLDRRHLLSEDVRRWGIERDLRLLTPGEFLAWHRLRAEGRG